jgi:hypothetical protein
MNLSLSLSLPHFNKTITVFTRPSFSLKKKKKNKERSLWGIQSQWDEQDTKTYLFQSQKYVFPPLEAFMTSNCILLLFAYCVIHLQIILQHGKQKLPTYWHYSIAWTLLQIQNQMTTKGTLFDKDKYKTF